MPHRRRSSKPKRSPNSNGSFKAKENVDSYHCSKRLFNSPLPQYKAALEARQCQDSTGGQAVVVYAKDLSSPAKPALVDADVFHSSCTVKPPPLPPMPLPLVAPSVPRLVGDLAPLPPVAPMPAATASQCPPTLPPMFIFNEPYCSAWWIQACRSDLAAANAQMVAMGTLGPFLDPFCPVCTMLMLKSAVLGGHIVMAARRWMQLVHSDDWLWETASSSGVISSPIYCPIPSPSPLVPGSSPIWIDSWEETPLNFYNAPKHLIMLFLCCVWLEANAADTWTGCGTEWPGKYPLTELLSDWVQGAFGRDVVIQMEEVVEMLQIASGGSYA